jgi:catechol 2,3-dioxygenase-like lactoylglutathione lyase family enzyme
MKRLHVSVAVSDIENSIEFYSTLFGAAPAVRKPDYAKWMLEDPHVNFSISSRGRSKGVDHLGIQVEDDGRIGARCRTPGKSRPGSLRAEGNHLLLCALEQGLGA